MSVPYKIALQPAVRHGARAVVNNLAMPIRDLVFTRAEWMLIADGLDMAQMYMTQTVKDAGRPLGQGLLDLMEREIGKTCDVKEQIRDALR